MLPDLHVRDSYPDEMLCPEIKVARLHGGVMA